MKSTLLAKTVSEKGYGLLAEKILYLNQKRLKDRCHTEMASITAQIHSKSQVIHSKAGRKMQDSLTMAAGKFSNIKMAIMKLNLKKMISQRKSAYKQYGEITEMNTVLKTELKEIKRTGFTNKDMLNTLLAKCYFQLIQKYEAIIAENQASFRLQLLEETMPDTLKLRSAMSRNVQVQLRDSLQDTEKTKELMPLVQTKISNLSNSMKNVANNEGRFDAKLYEHNEKVRQLRRLNKTLIIERFDLQRTLTLKQCMNMNLKSDNQKLLLEGNQGLKKMEKEYQNKHEIVENVKTEMTLLQVGINKSADRSVP